MEHRLILGGGEQYLPFARSRVKAMMATGSRYVSQKFVVDGTTITVRIEPGHEYITIEGQGCSFAMDSGVAESQFLSYGSFIATMPQNFTTGVLHDTSGTAAYNAAFSQLNPRGDYRINPGTGSSGQLAGVVTRGVDFKGALPVGTTARSFSPAQEQKEVNGVMTWVDVEKDTNLWLKKYTAANCPASVFTGRTRLYVQALYGSPLYKTESDRRNAVPNLPYTISPETYQYQPKLNIKSYIHEGDEATYADIQMTTSTGLWLDRSTGRHWLIDVTGDRVLFYPLIADRCGEAARKLLKIGSTLSTTDQHNLEAYILSTCLPDRSRMQDVAVNTLGAGTSMGYGWHWNYSGTCADIARNETIAVDENDHTGSRVLIMRSTHSRLTVSKTDVTLAPGDKTGYAQTWSASTSIVSGPSKWGVERGEYCIAATAGGALLEKQTPFRLNSYSPTNMFAGSGTFYVFYNGDNLKLCTVKVAYITAVTKTATSNDPAKVYPLGTSSVMNVRGGGGAWLEVKETQGAYWTTTFSVGDVVREMTRLLITDGWRRTAGGLRKNGLKVDPQFGIAGSAPLSIPAGTIRSDGTYDVVTSYGCNGYVYGGYYGCDGDRYSERVRRYYYSWGVIVTPSNDSQAAFIYSRNWVIKDQLDRQSNVVNAGGAISIAAFMYEVGVRPNTSEVRGGEIQATSYWEATGAGAYPDRTTYPPNLSGTESETDEKFLVCSAGAIPAPKFQLVASELLHETAVDSVYVETSTYTCAKESGVVISPPFEIQEGALGVTSFPLTPSQAGGKIKYPVMVGSV